MVSLAVALVVGLGGGWLLGEQMASDSVEGLDDDIVLDTPGEYQEPTGRENSQVAGETLPDVALVTADGDSVDSGSLVGGPLVINLWFSTCPPCKRELADFAEVHRDVGDRVRFVGIDPFDSPDVMERFAADRGVAYELLRDPDAAFVDAVGVVNYPVTLFVDADGVIVAETGELDADGLREQIERLF